MCLGSITPETRIFAIAQQEDVVETCMLLDDVKKVCEEEQVGEVGADGIRRFKHRRVLCRGAEVLVDGWLAVVVSLNMDAEEVCVQYSTTLTTTTVPLSTVRSVLTNPVNRDLQLGVSFAISSVSQFVQDIRKTLTTCPLLM